MFSSRRKKLLEHFTCCVCLDTVKNPRLCPSCSNMFCFECLSKCHAADSQRRCPLCRQVHVEDIKKYVRSAWVNKLTGIGKLEAPSACQPLSGSLSLYCNDCNDCNAIVTCASLEEDHFGHHVSSLKDACSRSRNDALQLKNEITAFQSQLIENQKAFYKAFSQDIIYNQHLIENKRYHQELSSLHKESLSLLLNRSNQVFDIQSREFRTSRLVCKEVLSELDRVLQEPDSIELMKVSKDVAKKFNSITKIETNYIGDVDRDLDKETISNSMSVCPEYSGTILRLRKFGSLFLNDTIVHTHSVLINHLDFKLEIHTSGLATHDSLYRQFLSLFLILNNPEPLKSTYDICVRVRVLKQFGDDDGDTESTFLIKVGPNYPKKIAVPDISVRLDSLIDLGLAPEESCLVVRFDVRPISFQTLSQIQEDYITELKTPTKEINGTYPRRVRGDSSSSLPEKMQVFDVVI